MESIGSCKRSWLFELCVQKSKGKVTAEEGGKRRQNLTHLATLRGLSTIRSHNLEDLERLLAILDRILAAVQDDERDREMMKQHLGLTAKEKLSEEYVREYKY